MNEGENLAPKRTREELQNAITNRLEEINKEKAAKQKSTEEKTFTQWLKTVGEKNKPVIETEEVTLTTPILETLPEEKGAEEEMVVNREDEEPEVITPPPVAKEEVASDAPVIRLDTSTPITEEEIPAPVVEKKEAEVNVDTTGIPLGKKTLEIPKNRVQEKMDAGMSEGSAMDAVKREMLLEQEEKNTGKKYTQQEISDMEKYGPKTDASAAAIENLKAGVEKDLVENKEESQKNPALKIVREGREQIRDVQVQKGETYTYIDSNGKEHTVTVIGDMNETRVNCIDLSTGKEKSVDALEITQAQKKREEQMIQEVKNKFGIKWDDFDTIRTNPVWQSFSNGQKQFVINSLGAVTLDRIDTIAAKQYKEDKKAAGFVKRLRMGMFKGASERSIKKDVFKKMYQGGFDEHQEQLETLIDRVASMNLPIIENEKGEIEIQYSRRFPGAEKSINEVPGRERRAFDQAATALQFIPTEWQLDTASKDERKKYKEAYDTYVKTRGELAGIKSLEEKILTQEDGDLRVQEEMVKIDSMIDLNRFLNAHPENERLMSLVGKNILVEGKEEAKNIFKDMFARDRKWQYFAGGALARKGIDAIKTQEGLSLWLGAAGAGAVSGVVGWLRGLKQGKANVRDNDRMVRRGEESDLRYGWSKKNQTEVGSEMLEIDLSREWTNTKGEEKSGASYLEKIDYLSRKLEAADQMEAATPEEIKQKNEKVTLYKTMLDNRVNYIMERARNGKISFGPEDRAFANQTAFTIAVNRGLSVSSAFDKDTLDTTKAKLLGFLEKAQAQDKTTDEATKKLQRKYVLKYAGTNAAKAAVFGAAGYLVKNLYDALQGHDVTGNTPKLGIEEMKSDRNYPPLNPGDPRLTLPPDAHQFADNPPTSGSGTGAWNETPPDAYIGKGEGIEHALRRQIEHNPDFAKKMGWDGKTDLHKFSGSAAHTFAIKNGYVDPKTGMETRVRMWGEGKEAPSYTIRSGADGTLSIEEGKVDNQYEYQHEGQAAHQTTLASKNVATLSIEEHPETNEIAENTVTDLSNGTPTEPIQHTQVVDKNPFHKKFTPWQTSKGPYATNNGPVATAESNVYLYKDGKYTPNYQTMNPGAQHYPLRVRPMGYGYPETEGVETGAAPYPEIPSEMFDGRVNNQYERLLEDVFGKDDFAHGVKTIDKDVAAILTEHDAAKDVTRFNFESEEGIKAFRDSKLPLPEKEYYYIISRLHQESDLAPIANEDPGLYMKEALQKMKNDDVNIRRFITNLEREIAGGFKIDAAKIKETALDDVYQ